MIDLNHVSVFAEVVKAGGFSAAARALGMPKATVSRNVARLETALGVRLLHRTTRKLELTGAGRGYFDEVSRALGQVRTANADAAAAQVVPSGTVRIAAPIAFGEHILVDWSIEFLRCFPKVSLELALDDGYVDLMRERIDVAFRSGRLTSSSFVARKLWPARRILVASPAYLRRRSAPRSLRDLGQHEGIVFGDSVESPVLPAEGTRSAAANLRGRIAVNSAAAARQAAVAGLGIALLPEGVIGDDLRAGRLQHLLPAWSIDAGAFYLIYPSRQHMSAAVRALIDFAITKAKAEGPF